MKKYFQKSASILMTCVLLLQTSLTVFATSSESEVYIETTPGKKESVQVVTSTQTNENITETVSKAKGYTTTDGIIVDYSSKEITTEKADGTATEFKEEYKAVNLADLCITYGGSESSESVTIPNFVVEIPLTAENNPSTEADETINAQKGDAVGSCKKTGDVKATEDDGEFDYIETTVIEQSGATIKTNSVERKETIVTDGEVFDYVVSGMNADSEKEISEYKHLNTHYSPSTNADELDAVKSTVSVKDGYQFVNLGANVFSNYWFAQLFTAPASEAEQPVYVHTNGQKYYVQYPNLSPFKSRDLLLSGLYIDGEYISAPAVEEGADPKSTYFPAQFDTLQCFYLVDKAGNVATTYCADADTQALKGYNYIITNVNDANYYDKDSADRIRAVAWNGFWGADSGKGSIADFKEGLKNSGNFTEEELAAITEGMSMTATQYAIWTYSNKMGDFAFVNTYYVPKVPKNYYLSKGNVFSAEKEKSDLLFKIYNYLINLEPDTLEEQNSYNTIINKQNFLDSAFIKIKDKSLENPLNIDADLNNDVYTADISFKLVAKPRTATEETMGDRLFVTVTDGEGNVIASGRVAGELAEGETMLVPVEGEYTFENIPLNEGAQTLRFFMNGEQYIEEGVYLYTSEVLDDTPSQTMVGIASGTRNVNVNTDISFDFTVADENIQTQRVWRNEKNIDPVVENIIGTKYFDGTAGENFAFVLCDNEGSEIEHATSDENGRFAFTPLEFKTPGTYSYTVKEVKGDDPGIIYDDTVFTCTYVIEFVEDKLIVTNKTVEGGETGEIVFENKTPAPTPKPTSTPEPTPTPVSPAVPKTGDTSHLVFYVMTALLSALAIIIIKLIIARKK